MPSACATLSAAAEAEWQRPVAGLLLGRGRRRMARRRAQNLQWAPKCSRPVVARLQGRAAAANERHQRQLLDVAGQQGQRQPCRLVPEHLERPAAVDTRCGGRPAACSANDRVGPGASRSRGHDGRRRRCREHATAQHARSSGSDARHTLQRRLRRGGAARQPGPVGDQGMRHAHVERWYGQPAVPDSR